MVAAAVSTTTPNPKTNPLPNKKSTRPPLLPNSESDNNVNRKQPKSREVTSRYMSSTTSSSSGSTTTTSGNSSSTSTTTTSSSSNSSNSPSFALKRVPSPSVTKLTPSTPVPGNTVKRSQSVDRRRPRTPSNSAAANLLVSSKRSLSASFQADTFSHPISKAKPSPVPATNASSSVRRGTSTSGKTNADTSSVRRGTPARRREMPMRDKTENFTSIDQHRWPGRSRDGNSVMTGSVDWTGERKKIGGSESVGRALGQSTIIDHRSKTPLDRRLNVQTMECESREVNFSMRTRSLDCTGDRRKMGGSDSVARALQLDQSLILDRRKNSLDRRFNVPSTTNGEFDANSVAGSVSSSDLIASDAESVSSRTSAAVQECGSVAQARGVPRGIMVPARFWQETTNRVKRMQEPKSPVFSNDGVKTVAPMPRLNTLKKSFVDGSILSPRGVVSNSRSLSSPIRGAVRPASPNKLVTSSVFSPSRGMLSPSRVRNGAAQISSSNDWSRTPSMLCFAAEARRGKVGENQVVDAHLLRLLHNRHLQLRFINARADAAMLAQKVSAQKSLYNAWVTTAKLWHSVKTKRAELQRLRCNLKLHSILKGQMLYLDDWDLIDQDHSSCLSGAAEALEASTVRLPLVGGARADIENVKDAICSAVDVMQGMASSICSLSTKVDQVNSVASELANVTAIERALLGQCKDLLSSLTAIQVKDCSLRTHVLQLKSVPSSLTEILKC